MNKVDFVFYLIAVFSYFSILLYFKDLQAKLKQIDETAKKKELMENRMKLLREKEASDREAEEKLKKQRQNVRQVINTVAEV